MLVYHPDSTYSGRLPGVPGVRFVDGVAEVTGKGALFHLRRLGYGMGEQSTPSEDEHDDADSGDDEHDVL